VIVMSDSATQLIVKGTFVLLLFGSVVTWALVLLKGRQRWVTQRQDRRFLAALKPPLTVPALAALDGHRGPSWRVVRAGLAALEQSEQATARGVEHDETPREAVERGLQAQIEGERRAAEGGLVVLASIGTTAPFVGLFGTVWGIINALRAIGHSGSASLEVVAGPIGEALVATAVGIAVAVPAVLAYNFFLRRLKLQAADLGQLGAVVVAAAGRHQTPVVRAVAAATLAGAATPLHVERKAAGERRETSV
jgi:biopolymer transport protein ExbB